MAGRYGVKVYQSTTNNQQPTMELFMSEQTEANKNLPVATIAMPDLSAYEEDVISLGNAYWTPSEKGEYKRGVIVGVESQQYERIDETTGEVTYIDLPCVIFAAQNEDLTLSRMANGSKRLVATIEQSLRTGAIIALKTPVIIKYMGKVKNTTNAFKSDSFEVKELKPRA